MNFKRAIKTIGALAYKNRSTIETVGGLFAIAVGTGEIISKAKQAADISYQIEDMMDDIHQRDVEDGWESKKDRSREVRGVLKFATVNYTKTYAPGILFQLVGGTLIAVSDISQAKELSATSALLATTSATLSAVKERVIADQGEEKWQEYLLGPQFTTVDVLPDGTVVQTTNPLENPNAGIGLPPHCFIFDDYNCPDAWEKDPFLNRKFLEDHQRWLNEKLWAEGFLFENDIRRDLKAPLVKSGWTSGIMAEKIDPVTGDKVRNYLSLGLDANNPMAQAFRDGVEPSIVIQMNVEDNIIDQLQLELI